MTLERAGFKFGAEMRELGERSAVGLVAAHNLAREESAAVVLSQRAVYHQAVRNVGLAPP